MIKESNENFVWKNAKVFLVPVSQVKVDPQERVRKEVEDFRERPRYLALKESIIEFGLRNPISLRTNMILVEGFIRFSIVSELGWEEIPAIISDLTKFEALKLELQENFCRMNFSEYEKYLGIAEYKRLYEKQNPEVKKGKYNRNSNNNNHHKSISAKLARMIPSQDNKKLSFGDACLKEFGIARRTSFRYARIGEAILDNKFDTKTIKKISDGAITQEELLDLIRRDENKLIIQKGMQKTTKENKKEPNITEITKPPQEERPLYDVRRTRTQIIDDFNQAGRDYEKRCELAKSENKPKIEESINQEPSVKPNRESIPTHNTKKLIGDVKTTLAPSQGPRKVTDEEVEALKKNSLRYELIALQSEKTKSLCIDCPRASVRAIHYKQNIKIICEKCNQEDMFTLEGFAQTVICDKDFINGSLPPLRNPYNEQCSLSPDREL